MRNPKKISLGECKICGRIFDAIPEDAAKIGVPWYHFQLYRFADGTAHNIRVANPKKKSEPEVIPASPDGVRDEQV